MPKRSRRRISKENAAALDDLYNYANAFPICRGRRYKAEDKIIVTDDWPAFVPITEAELRVMEAHFAKELDELFGPRP